MLELGPVSPFQVLEQPEDGSGPTSPPRLALHPQTNGAWTYLDPLEVPAVGLRELSGPGEQALPVCLGKTCPPSQPTTTCLHFSGERVGVKTTVPPEALPSPLYGWVPKDTPTSPGSDADAYGKAPWLCIHNLGAGRRHPQTFPESG